MIHSTWLLWLLRLIHILTGIFWVGSILFMARFLLPAARALGPAAGPVMDYLTRVGRLPQTILSAAGFTIVSGLTLYWHDSLGFQSEWMRTPTAMVFGTGGLLTIVALVIGLSVNTPTAKRLGALAGAIQAQGGKPSPDQAAELQRLQARLGVALRAVSGLLVLAAAAMAVARYVS
jgi:uncharacterized membrane protein